MSLLTLPKSINALAFLLLIGCAQPQQEKLIWADEFDYSGYPDNSKWDYDLGNGCPQLCGWGNNERQYYTNDLHNVRVENGLLIIEAHQRADSARPYTSARLVTRGKAQWKYARIEVRARLPKGRGTWPAIWMLPTDWAYGGWPASGEIDVMEHVGFDPGVIHGTIHTEVYNHMKKTQKEGIVHVADAQEGFHVYSVNWSENTIEFFVDNKRYHSVVRSPNDTFREWPFDQRFYLILNIAVGGFWGGRQGIDDSILPQRMEVDYVRVFNK